MLQHERYVALPADAIRQGTPEWFSARETVTFTGSVPGGFVYAYTASMYRDKYKRVIMKDPSVPDDFSAAARARMQWGTDHEDDAVLTFLEAFPEFKVHEASFVVNASQSRVGASPDGLVQYVDATEPHAVLEIKCPSKKNREGVRVPHAKIPEYYLWQLLMEMHVTGTKQAYFVSWGELETKVWHVRPRMRDFRALWEYLEFLETAPEGYVREELSVPSGYQLGRCERFVPGSECTKIWKLRTQYACEEDGMTFNEMSGVIKEYKLRSKAILGDIAECLGTYDSCMR